MKVVLILLIVLFIGAVGFFAVKRVFTLAPSETPSIEVTLQGTLTEVTPTSEYSFVLKGTQGSTGINSMKVDLRKYKNKSVTVTGQYSGTVLYADTVTILQ